MKTVWLGIVLISGFQCWLVLRQQRHYQSSFARNNPDIEHSSTPQPLRFRTALQQWGNFNATRTLNDQTISIFYDVETGFHKNEQRLGPEPPARVLLTNYGWNHPNQTHRGLQFPRSLRMREILGGIVQHPWFEPTGWEDFTSGRREMNPRQRYYVFLDVETCFESNWPAYGRGYQANSDRFGGRRVRPKVSAPCRRLENCEYLHKALNSSVFLHRGRNSTHDRRHVIMIYFDCRGSGVNAKLRAEIFPDAPIALVSMSSSKTQLQGEFDQGLPPPAATSIELDEVQKERIQDCDESSRPYKLSFIGNFRHFIRTELQFLHNGDTFIVLNNTELNQQRPNETYTDILAKSQFAATPRGDNLFTYRFTEALASGAIPVVLADHWVLPFRPELVDWTGCAITIPEGRAITTEYVVNAISSEEICRRRQRCYQIYETYIMSATKTVTAIVDGLELVDIPGTEEKLL
jgi:hypothetical protein